MTIVEAVEYVLLQENRAMTAEQIYRKIIEENLYSFPAKNPLSVVKWEIRRHCSNLEFATSSKVRLFSVVGVDKKQTLYNLDNGKTTYFMGGTEEVGEDILPEEMMQSASEKHLSSIIEQLLSTILLNTPSFFEHLIVDLLLHMGYGKDQDDGVVIGKPHDGGIDGIISEDKLGLEKIYLQAKRYSDGTRVGRKEIQAFVGAMQEVNKGVFITTSSFTREAIQYANNQQQKRLKLIDGKELAESMIKYGVGVVPKKKYVIFEIDQDYFN